MNKTKGMYSVIIGIAVFALLIFSASYAYLAASISNSNKANATAKLPIQTSFITDGSSCSMNIQFNQMLDNNVSSTLPIATTSCDIDVMVNGNQNGYCLYDLVLADESTTHYVPSAGVGTTYPFEFTGQITYSHTSSLSSKNLFSNDFSQFTSQGGTGTTYNYFKLPDDGKTYTLSVSLKDDSVDYGTGNVFGVTGNGGDANGGYTWLVNANTISKSQITLTPSSYRYITIYRKTETTFENLLARYNIQLEEGSTATTYEPPQNMTLETNVDKLTGTLLKDKNITIKQTNTAVHDHYDLTIKWYNLNLDQDSQLSKNYKLTLKADNIRC